MTATAVLSAIVSIVPAFAKTSPRAQQPSLMQIQQAAKGLSLVTVDASGAAIPNATVSLRNEVDGKKLIAQCNESAQVRLEDRPSGSYELSVVVPGFSILSSPV